MILVAGSIHIDILATVTGDPATKDRVGKVKTDIGGTAGNIAINCATLKIPARLLTAQNGSAYSKVILQHLDDCGVDHVVQFDDSLAEAAFVAEIGSDGELKQAISSMPVDEIEFTDQVLEKAFDGVKVLIADCNLSVRSLIRVCKEAEKRGIPSYMAGVSEEKSLRAAQAVLSGAKVDCIYINRREANYVKRHVLELDSLDGVDQKETDIEMAGKLGCSLSVTEGSRGATLITPVDIHYFEPVVVGDRVYTLGAGDAYIASSVVAHVFAEMDFRTSLREAVYTAAEVVKRENCNLSDARAIDRAINLFHSKAHHDGMTGLLNRVTTETRAEKELEKCFKRGTPFSVIILDIDHFKSVNDTFGHDVGDVVIKAVADVIKNTMRATDICGRFGGEEFVCALPQAPIEASAKTAERIRSVVQDTIHHPRAITISLGVAIALPGEDFHQVLKRADTALYYSKQHGRNQVSISVENQTSV